MRFQVVGVAIFGASLAAFSGAAVLAGCSLRVTLDGDYSCELDGRCPPGFVCDDSGRCAPDPGAADPDGGTDAAPGGQDGPPWWDDDWQKRRRVTVANAGGGTLEYGFQARLVVDVDLLLGGDAEGSLRLMHHDGGNRWTEMPRVIDRFPASFADDEALWLPLWEDLEPGDDVDHYWLYYDNPQGDGASADPADLFDLWTPFDVLDQQQLTYTGAVTVQNGELRLDPGEQARSLAIYGPGHAVDFVLRMPIWTFRAWGGFQKPSFDLSDPWMLWITRMDVSQIQTEVFASSLGQGAPTVGVSVTIDTEPYQYSVERHEDRAGFRIEQGPATFLELPAPLAVGLAARLTGDGAAPVFFDWLRVRQVAETAPLVTLGVEETYPGP